VCLASRPGRFTSGKRNPVPRKVQHIVAGTIAVEKFTIKNNQPAKLLNDRHGAFFFSKVTMLVNKFKICREPKCAPFCLQFAPFDAALS
jgi:hypothetical protein